MSVFIGFIGNAFENNRRVVAQDAQFNSDALTVEREARREIQLFKDEIDLPFYVPGSTTDHSDPLLWWSEHEYKFPYLAILAKRCLCIPATSAPSERLFSDTGLVITEKRNRLDGENVNQLVFLNKNWSIVELIITNMKQKKIEKPTHYKALTNPQDIIELFDAPA